MPTFEPPFVLDVPTTLATRHPGNALMRHYRPGPRGRSVLRIAGAYQTIDTPTQTQIDAATEVYLGGHVHQVDQATADRLVAAGYTVT